MAKWLQRQWRDDRDRRNHAAFARAHGGDAIASGQLFALLYADLKRLARGKLHRIGGRDELDTTMLVHESFVKLAAGGAVAPSDRAAYFGYVGKVMRSVVLDSVRERHADKRGGGAVPLTLTTGIAQEALEDQEIIALDDALTSLAKLAPSLHQLVELRYFAGLSVAEVSEVSGRSVRSVERDWEKARALLRKLVEERG